MYQYSSLTEEIINVFYTVYNTLGVGFTERVYAQAVCTELHKQGLAVQQEVPVAVYYGGAQVGSHTLGVLVEKKVFVDISTAETLHTEDAARMTNVLNATEVEVGLLLGFCRTPQVKSKVIENAHKPALKAAPRHGTIENGLGQHAQNLSEHGTLHHQS